MPLKVLAVFGLGIAELWATIPAGFAFGINPVIIGAVSAAGASIEVVIIILLGERIRVWFTRRYDIRSKGSRHGVARRTWDRWGIIGL